MNSVYPSVEHRQIAACLERLAPFAPDRNAPVSVEAQRTLYEFVHGLLLRLYEDPELLFPGLHADGVFTYRFNRAHDKNPELDRAVRAARARIDALFEDLFALGKGAEGDAIKADLMLKLPKRHAAVLSAMGLERDGQQLRAGKWVEMLPALRWMAEREGACSKELALALFDRGYSYALDVFASLLGEDSARDLARWLEENGYERGGDLRDGKLSLDYTKDYGKKPSPVKDAWAERTHAGISVQHHDYVAKPACIALRAPMLKELLGRFDEMEPELQSFVALRTKKCDACGYCTQTDKTGRRHLACVSVKYGGHAYALCPLFPGFTYCWTELSGELSDGIRCFLLFADQIFGR